MFTTLRFKVEGRVTKKPSSGELLRTLNIQMDWERLA